MANQLKVEIIGEPQSIEDASRDAVRAVSAAEKQIEEFGRNSRFGEDMARQVERAQRETLSLQKSFNSIRGPAGTFDLLTRDAQRAQAHSFQLQRELEKIKKLSLRGGTPTFMAALTDEAAVLERALKRLQQEELRLQIRSASRRPGAPGAGGGPTGGGGLGVGGDIISGLGIPLGVAAGVGAATALFVSGLHSAMDAARQASDANRVLSASATEAGFSYDVATEKALKFADQTGLSDTQAKKTFSSLMQVANVAGQTEDLDLIQKRFADLAAARGVAAADLSTLAQQILSGQDEALNRIGLADPSKLAADWAAAHGKTVESMTQSEQVASRLDAVMRKGAMFDGSAEERLRSVSGQIEIANQHWSNMTTNVGEAIFANMEFRDLLSTINGLLQSISLSSDDVGKKLAAGLTPEQIAKQAVDDNQVTDAIKTSLTALPASLSYYYELISEGSEVANNRLIYALDPGMRRAEEVQRLVEAEQLSIETQKKAAEDQKRLNEEKRRREADQLAAALSAREQVAKLNTQISRDPSLQSQLAGLQQLRQEVEGYSSSGTLAANTAKEFRDQLKGVDEQIFQTNKRIEENIRATFKETRTFLDDMTQRVNRDNPFVTLFQQADTVMERTRTRFGAFGDEFVQQMARVESQALEMEKIALRIQS